METNLISWNIVNWITVVLMVVVGVALLHLISQGVHRVLPNKSGE